MEVFALYYAVAGSAALIIAVMLAVTGGLTAASGGIAASLVFGVLAALFGKSRDQS